MTTERTHLSIGEVLSLLQTEFPDITISKIRFLESQGLLDPERTPSGYRKFHDEDIDRLRWILTQQRDHFLPLKVIKDRLAAGDLGSGAPEGVLPLAAESGNGASAAATNGADAGLDVARSTDIAVAVAGSAADSDDIPGAGGDISSMPEEAAADEPAADHSQNGSGADAGHDRADAVAHLVEGPAPAVVEPEPAPPTPTPKGGRRRHPTGHQPGEPTPDDDASEGDVDADAASRSLSLDELVARSGLSSREIGELERYGLISGDTEDQVTTYDEEVLVVARLASGFSRYGIEPRHLRMYKVAAEREAGLFEQLITPLLKQRRASARQQAVDMLEELAELADDLRAAMVRTALREYLGSD